MSSDNSTFEIKFPYKFDPKYEKAAAYFSMEFAIDQSLKTYSGGLGFLAGSHMRSSFDLHQNLIGIGMLWKYGYYDQIRNGDKTMNVLFQEKIYSFLVDHTPPCFLGVDLGTMTPRRLLLATVFLIAALCPPLQAGDVWLAGIISPLVEGESTDEIVPDLPIDAIPPLNDPVLIPCACRPCAVDRWGWSSAPIPDRPFEFRRAA